MMKIDVLTLFPNMIEGFLNESIIKRAREKGIVEVNLINFRDYSKLNNHQVDDTMYGGGPGMVLRCEPIFECIDHIKKENSIVVLMTPDGTVFNESIAVSFSKIEHLIIICGHYEGFDERIRVLADYEISLGDFILTGGEIPAIAIIDAVARLLPDAINKESLDSESFNESLLDYPVYTKPSEYRGMRVPSILISGDHKKISEWRKSEQIKKTREKRPDLMKGK